MSRFRVFLQNLKPGEIGFAIASVGTASATVLTLNSFAQASRQKEADRRKEWKKMTHRVEQLVSEGTPYRGLSTIKFYQARLRQEAVQVGVENATHDEICDEWIRRRNKGDEDALKVEHVRLRLKRFWHSIETAAQYRIQQMEAANEEKKTANVTKIHADGNVGNKESESGVLKDLLGGGMGNHQANDRLVLKTLMFLERLDLACCRNHPKCLWERDSPSFYSFLRQQYEIPMKWPDDTTNVDDFARDAPSMNSPEHKRLYQTVPPSRVAQMMEKREGRRAVWAKALGGVEAAIEHRGSAWVGGSEKK